MRAPTPPRLQTLEEIAAAVWQQLAQGAAQREHGWNKAVLATVDGDRADARFVVLREVDAATRQLVFYSDDRAGKVLQIVRNPHGTVVLWSAELGWQLRCRVLLSVESSGLAATSRWARVRLTGNARDYLGPHPPGTEIAAPGQPVPAGGSGFFAMIAASVLALDWLELDPAGHRRAIFDDAGARWVQP